MKILVSFTICSHQISQWCNKCNKPVPVLKMFRLGCSLHFRISGMTRSCLQNYHRTLLPVAALYSCLHPFQLCCPEVSLVSVHLLCKFQAPVFEECWPLQRFHCLTQQNHTFERPYIMCKTKCILDYIWCGWFYKIYPFTSDIWTETRVM